MRLVDVDEAKDRIRQMRTLKPSEKMLLRLALARTPTYEPPNPPLTLEELREMDGEPVWVKHCNGEEWVTVHWNYVGRITTSCKAWLFDHEYGETWLAYRRKPEEGTT